MKTTYCSDIRARQWERFAYLAAGIALSVRMKAPFRDALRKSFGNEMFVRLLSEVFTVGQAAGADPCPVRARTYQHAFMLDARPVMPPPSIAEGGRAGDEAAFLLAELIGFARQYGVRTPELNIAWQLANTVSNGGSGPQPRSNTPHLGGEVLQQSEVYDSAEVEASD